VKLAVDGTVSVPAFVIDEVAESVLAPVVSEKLEALSARFCPKTNPPPPEDAGSTFLPLDSTELLPSVTLPPSSTSFFRSSLA